MSAYGIAGRTARGLACAVLALATATVAVGIAQALWRLPAVERPALSGVARTAGDLRPQPGARWRLRAEWAPLLPLDGNGSPARGR